jgi:hypothetical protein
VKVTIGVIQDGVALTSGSLQDWSWLGLDLGTAIWPVVGTKQKSERRLSRPEVEHWDIDAITTGADTALELAVVLAKDDALARMESAATAGDERAFLSAKDEVDWEARPAIDFLRAVQLALSAGAHMAARNLATQGAARYPDDANLQKYAWLLAPPRVLRSDAPPHPGLRANRDWLMAHGNEYRGRWVALHQGELLGVSDSLVALKELIGDTSNILLTKVF